MKEQFLAIKSKVDTVVRQNVSLKDERFGAALLGNPGTGETSSLDARTSLISMHRQNDRCSPLCEVPIQCWSHPGQLFSRNVGLVFG